MLVGMFMLLFAGVDNTAMAILLVAAPGVVNIPMAISLVPSARGLSLMPAYAKNWLPWSVVSRPLKGEIPTIDLVVGYSNTSSSPILKLLLSRLGELIAH